MPIHLDVLQPRQAEAGKIKIGRQGEKRKKRSGKGEFQLPEKLDHFIVTTNERDDETSNFIVDDALMAQLPKDADGKVRKIPILLSSDDLDEVFPHALVCYVGKNLHCRGDGKTALRWELDTIRVDGRDVTVRLDKAPATVQCPCSYLKAKEGKRCKPHGTLWTTIQAGEETQIGARHSFRTTSWDSIRHIRAGLQEIQQLIGTLVGPPLTMEIHPHKVRPKGETASKTVYIVHVICRSRDLASLRRRALEEAQMRHNVAHVAGHPLRLGLPAPGVGETPDEIGEIKAEWDPEEPADDIDFDPETGEVIDAGATDPPSPEPEDQSPEDPDTPLPEGHRVRNRIQGLLTDLAKIRDFSAKDMKQGRLEIWKEVTEAVDLKGLAWKDLTITRAVEIDEALAERIRAANEG